MKKGAYVFGVISLVAFFLGLIALVAMAILSGYGRSWMEEDTLLKFESACKAVFVPSFGICGVCFAISFFVENHKAKKKDDK